VAVVKVAAAAARPIFLPSCPQLVVGAAAAYGKDVGPSPFLWIDESIMLDKEYESISERAKSNALIAVELLIRKNFVFERIAQISTFKIIIGWTRRMGGWWVW
jgi:hypothetical protein